MTAALDPPALVLVGAALLSTVSVRGMLTVARRRRLLAFPNERSSHSAPTPSSGGLGLAAGAALALAVAGAAAGARAPVVIAAVVVFASLLGLYDDRRALGARSKLIAVTLAALPVLMVVRLTAVPLPCAGTLELGLLSLPLTLFWLVGYANAFNFMDGIDGIAGWTAAVAGGAYLVLGLLTGDALTAALGAATAGASLGFLPWNFPRARIFMGDAGSLPLGLLLAVCALTAADSGALPFPASVLLLGPFLFDVILTLVRRTREGKRLGEAHREHLYQRLARSLGSHPPVSLLYAGFGLSTAAAAFAYRDSGGLGQVLSLSVPLAAMLAFAVHVLRRDRDAGTPPGESA